MVKAIKLRDWFGHGLGNACRDRTEPKAAPALLFHPPRRTDVYPVKRMTMASGRLKTGQWVSLRIRLR